MTKEKLKENFPVGCKVKLMDNKGMFTPLGSIGTVMGYKQGHHEEYFIDIKWDRPDSNFLQCDGGYASYRFEVVWHMTKPQVSKPSEWNSVCQRCGAPAYQGLFKVDCSKGCK